MLCGLIVDLLYNQPAPKEPAVCPVCQMQTNKKANDAPAIFCGMIVGLPYNQPVSVETRYLSSLPKH
jgi:hypothetical protein